MSAKIIAINSQKPGVGKSFITKETAALLAKKQRSAKILIIDVDSQNFSMGNAFGLTSAVMQNFNITTVLKEIEESNYDKSKFDKENFLSSLYTYNKSSDISRILRNLKILPMKSLSKDERYTFSSKSFEILLEIIKNDFDYIFIDTNSNYTVDGLTVAGFKKADIILQVTSNDKNSIDATKHYMDELKTNNPTIFNKCTLVYNQIPDEFEYKDSEDILDDNLDYFRSLFKNPILKVTKLSDEEMNLFLEHSSFLSLEEREVKKFLRKPYTEPYYEELYNDILRINKYIHAKKKGA